MKILIVDDSRAMRLIVMRGLRQAGYGEAEYLEAANGHEALEMVDQEPDIVISDWNMPDMSGIELLKALREAGSKLKFGFITSEISARMRDEAFEAGASFYLAKPFDPDKLRQSMRSALRFSS